MVTSTIIVPYYGAMEYGVTMVTRFYYFTVYTSKHVLTQGDMQGVAANTFFENIILVDLYLKIYKVIKFNNNLNMELN